MQILTLFHFHSKPKNNPKVGITFYECSEIQSHKGVMALL